MAAQADRGVPLSTLSPKFLHTNSTSHTWPFSAIAELIDNAYDPDVSAKQFWIDKTVFKGQECLTFMDNGNGLNHKTMHKMLSFGYSDKTAVNGLEPIGLYGNGFKSGSMRLGRDAIVFSKSRTMSCVGMLSQTYLEKIGAEQLIVPIVCFEGENSFRVKEEHKASLQDILRYSPFEKEEELLTEINAISSSWTGGKTGTRIIIWNLRRTSTGTTEFDFHTDRYDIRIPSDVYEELNKSQNPDRAISHAPESFYSLRAYCSILYLKPRMQVNIRGQKVKSQLIAKSLALIRKDHYKPTFLKNKRIPITFGYNTKSKDQYGIMMYHKNRLIKAYERVGCQLRADQKGIGVIGVIECNFLDPTHNKQSFNETDKYRKTMSNLALKLEEYWKEIRHRRARENPNSTTPVEDTIKAPDQIWVQCDDCLQWRKLPDGIDRSKLPDKWFCRLNPDPQFRSCVVPEEPEDSDDDQPSYRKTYKQQERENKKKQGTNTPKMVAFSSTAPRSRSLQGGAVRFESPLLSPSIISQAACSPSTSSGLPVISSVCSLSGALRGKRSQPASPQTPLKRPRVNGLNRRILNTASSADVTPQTSPSVPASNNDDDDDDDDTDDDIVILETGSTPKPQNPPMCLRDIKKEAEQNDNNVDMLLESSDNAAMDATTEPTRSVGPAAVEAPPQEASGTSTQTEVTTFKEEVQSQCQTEEQSVCNRSGEDHSSDVSNAERRVFKQESSEEIQTAQSGAEYLESAENAGPSFADGGDEKFSPHHLAILTEQQRQQDQLLELMQETALERDSLKQQVCDLTSRLQDMQGRLLELSHLKKTKYATHRACQTEETEQERDYKTLFEKAKNKVNDLIKDKVALMTATETKAGLGNAQDEADDVDQIARQVDFVMQELDQRNKERNELHSQLDNLEEQKAALAAQCEELRLILQQQKENTPEESKAPQRITASPGGTADSGKHSSSENSSFLSLIALRQNIGHLLVNFVPALDLEQVNYECNVIDEILEQVLDDVDSVLPTKVINK